MRRQHILFHVVSVSLKRQYELFLAQSEISSPQLNRVRFSQGSQRSGDRSSLVGGSLVGSGPQLVFNNTCVYTSVFLDLAHMLTFNVKDQFPEMPCSQSPVVFSYIMINFCRHQGSLAGSTPEPNRRFSTPPHNLVSRTFSAPSPSLQRRISTNTPSIFYLKNRGHRFNVQLKKGEANQ